MRNLFPKMKVSFWTTMRVVAHAFDDQRAREYMKNKKKRNEEIRS